MFASLDRGASQMGSAGSEYSEFLRTCDKTWPVSRFGERVNTAENTNVYMDAPTLQKRDSQKGSGVTHPELRITHRVCWVEALETFLPVMNRFIYRA